MDQMAEDHARDYRVKQLADNAYFALSVLLQSEEAQGRVSQNRRVDLEYASHILNAISEGVVGTWN